MQDGCGEGAAGDEPARWLVSGERASSYRKA